jgi:hypothetical protein
MRGHLSWEAMPRSQDGASSRALDQPCGYGMAPIQLQYALIITIVLMSKALRLVMARKMEHTSYEDMRGTTAGCIMVGTIIPLELTGCR